MSCWPQRTFRKKEIKVYEIPEENVEECKEHGITQSQQSSKSNPGVIIGTHNWD